MQNSAPPRFAQLVADFVADLPLHTLIAATDKGAADFNAVRRCHDAPAGPARMQDRIALQAASYVASERKDRMGILGFEGVSHGVLAQNADALGERAVAALRLDLLEIKKLASRTQEDGVKHLLPGV